MAWPLAASHSSVCSTPCPLSTEPGCSLHCIVAGSALSASALTMRSAGSALGRSCGVGRARPRGAQGPGGACEPSPAQPSARACVRACVCASSSAQGRQDKTGQTQTARRTLHRHTRRTRAHAHTGRTHGTHLLVGKDEQRGAAQPALRHEAVQLGARARQPREVGGVEHEDEAVRGGAERGGVLSPLRAELRARRARAAARAGSASASPPPRAARRALTLPPCAAAARAPARARAPSALRPARARGGGSA